MDWFWVIECIYCSYKNEKIIYVFYFFIHTSSISYGGLIIIYFFIHFTVQNPFSITNYQIQCKDRVALVTAAPPSYTRMYHYFPAHLTHPFCFYPQPPPPPLPPPSTHKGIGNSITSMTPAHLAHTLRYPGKVCILFPN